MDEEDEVSRSDSLTVSVDDEAVVVPNTELVTLKPVSYEIENVANMQNDDIANEQVNINDSNADEQVNIKDSSADEQINTNVGIADEQVNIDTNEQTDDVIIKPVDTNETADNATDDHVESVTNERVDSVTTEEHETDTNEQVDYSMKDRVDIDTSEQHNDDSMELADNSDQNGQLDDTMSSTPQESSVTISCNETITADEQTIVGPAEVKRKRRYQRKIYGNDDSSGTPGESRYGRIRKPKLANDFVSVDRKSFAVLNSSSYKHVFVEGEECSPPKIAKVIKREKIPGRGRGRPRKNVPNVDNDTETVSKIVDCIEPVSNVDEVHSISIDESSINSINSNTVKTYSKLGETIAVSTPEASQDEQEDVEKTSLSPQVNYPELDWRVGDIAWARIGCYPYWPSIVTLEYGSSIYVKPVGKLGRLAVHVQFFGDRGRRSWVLTSSLIKYESKEQFMELKRQYKKDKFRFKNFNVLRMKDLWDKSITEADTILKLPYEDRIQHYQTMYPVSEEIYVAELANASKMKPSIRRLRKNMKRGRRGRRRILDGDGVRRGRKKKQPAQLVSTPAGTNENVTALTDSLSSSAVLDDSSKPLKKRKRKPMDEHIKKRRAFERRLNKMLQESEHVRPNKSDRQGKNSAKLQRMKNAQFNALLKSGGNTSNATNSSEKLPRSSSNLSHLSEEKKSALSVYDFESDEEEGVFMSYNSRFSSQVLPKTEKKEDDTADGEMEGGTVEVVEEESKVGTSSESKVETSSDTTEENAVVTKDDTETNKSAEVIRRGRGRPKGSKNMTKAMKLQQKLAQRRRPTQGGQVAGARRRKGTSSFVRRKQPAGAIKSESDGIDLAGDTEESPVKLICELEDLQKINKLIPIEDEQSSDEDEYKSTEDEKRRSLSPDKTPSGRVKKRSSLFAGMKNERVCFICGKAGDTVRCRGPCDGTYHIECERKQYAIDVAEEVAQKPRRGRKSRKSMLPVKDDEVKTGQLKEEETDENVTDKMKEGDEESAEKLQIENDDEKTAEMKVSETMDVDESLADEKTTEKNDPEAMDEDENIADETIADKKEMDENENGENVVKEKDAEVNAVKDESAAKEKVDAEANDEVEKSEEKEESEDDHTRKETEDAKEEAASCSTIVDTDANTSSVEFRCKKCTDNELYACFTCGLVTQEKTGETERYSCYLPYCGRVYHKECLKAWPQATWIHNSLNKQIKNGSGSTAKETLMCPQHYCHTCISEDPTFHKNKESKERLVRCIRCPTSYHKRVHCIPAGTEILSLTQIICPRHYEPPPGAGHCNTNWCCICCVGGSLICCEDCPMAFHAECLDLRPEEYEGRYICEDCRNGRCLLYGEVTWVKLGHYRWWPAQILYPSQVPDNIRNITHRRGEFAVRFFGSNNYNWISRGRSFVYQDGDSGKNSCGRKSVDMVFVKALEEAKQAYQLLRIAKAARDKEHRAGLKPPKYGRISANKPIGNVRIVELNTSNMTACECDPKSERPCAPDSDCLNRMLLVECNPAVCEAGERCLNQAFEKRLYPPLMPFKTEKRGWGLKALVDLKKGDFIIEYVGEMISEEEYQRRLNIMHKNQEVNYYFLTINKDRMLDAGPKGNVSRFMNHSCDPNCETQKWTVNGDTRVGLFTLKDVPANTELTFNYNLVSQGNEMKPCYCGSDKCAGFIGLRPTKQNGGITNDDETRKKSCDDNRKKSNENGNGESRKITGRKRGRPRLESKSSTPVPSGDDSCSKSAVDNEQTATPGEPPKKRKRFRKPSIVRNSTNFIDNDENNGAISNENVESTIGTVPISDLPPKKRECVGKLSETSMANDNDEKVEKIEEKKDKKSTPTVETQAPTVKRGRGRPKKTKANVETKKTKANNLEKKTKAGRRRIRKKALLKKRQVEAVDVKKKSLAIDEETRKEIATAKKPKPIVDNTESKSEQEKQESLFRMMKKRIDNKFIEMSSIDGLEQVCFVCGKSKGSDLLLCDYIACPKGYHLSCLNKTTAPKGRWLCPWHNCKICKELGNVKQCQKCTNSYCKQHAKGRIFNTDAGYVCKKHNSNVKIQGTIKEQCNQELQDAEVSSSNKNDKEAEQNRTNLNNGDANENNKRKLAPKAKKIKRVNSLKKNVSNEKRKQTLAEGGGKKSLSVMKRVSNEKRSENPAVAKPKIKKKQIESSKSLKKKVNPSANVKKENTIIVKKVKKNNTLAKKKVIRLVGNENKHIMVRKKKKLVANKTSEKNKTIAAATSDKLKTAKVEKEMITKNKEMKIEEKTMEYTVDSEINDSDTFIEEYHPEDFPPADHVKENLVETKVVEETNRKMESDDSFVSCISTTEDGKNIEESDKEDQYSSDDEIVNLEVEEVDNDDFSR